MITPVISYVEKDDSDEIIVCLGNEVHELPTSGTEETFSPSKRPTPGRVRFESTDESAESSQFTRYTLFPAVPNHRPRGGPPRRSKMVTRGGRRREEIHPEQPQPRILDPYLERMICRMRKASKRTVLSRLEETWDIVLDQTQQLDVEQEKSLWILTALESWHQQELPDIAPDEIIDWDRNSISEAQTLTQLIHTYAKTLSRLGRNLELACSPCKRPPWCHSISALMIHAVEVLQLSCSHPNGSFAYIAPASSTADLALPRNVALMSVFDTKDVRISLPDRSVDCIRATSLVAACPAAEIKPLLRECERILVPGGAMEIRLIDPTPTSAGPLLRQWLEKNLLLNLERDFRCVRPLLLVPIWAKEADFDIHEDSDARSGKSSFPVSSADTEKAPEKPTEKSIEKSIERKLSVHIGRWLWRDAWARFVGGDTPVKMWWEVEEIMKECQKKRTSIEVKALFARKSPK